MGASFWQLIYQQRANLAFAGRFERFYESFPVFRGVPKVKPLEHTEFCGLADYILIGFSRVFLFLPHSAFKFDEFEGSEKKGVFVAGRAAHLQGRQIAGAADVLMALFRVTNDCLHRLSYMLNLCDRLGIGLLSVPRLIPRWHSYRYRLL
jgi:hypothetical protein